MQNNISTKNKIKILVALFLIIVVGAMIVLSIVGNKNAPQIPVFNNVEKVATTTPAFAVIGNSLLGRPIESYTFGKGEDNITFIGGIHGGYEWNSVYLAYEFVDYLTKYPEIIPDNLSISIIPNANPDGLFEIVGSGGRFELTDIKNEDQPNGKGRFNSNKVDLNRNFDCKWKSEGVWRGKVVSAGTSAFSEPEAKALRDFINKNSPSAVVSWHSMAGTVYAGECGQGVLPATRAIMNAYATSAGYKTSETFDSYPVTGDLEGWISTLGIPAITVELATHQTIEWEKNLAGFKSVLNYFKLQQ